ncbi:MAG TPA: (E)-4-hydroxy-3-methylbut-2-enyl-diphosphate synthase [Opitutaceae bacterium]|nr:(E)-4-hydroxy-3-methylbut-2-enyl-diphosphate synthase [Opitutaceae bacterium]
MAYCASRFRTVRRPTVEVRVGSVGVGGSNPLRLQSMTTSDTQDVDATVRQCIALAEVGCEIVRITAPNVPAAKCLQPIREKFTAAGFGAVPLVADIHFLPSAAMAAVEHVEKVRVNPGNYADKKKFATREYTDVEYDRELQRLHDAFSPLVQRCRQLGRALRIGTNHGSLSDRIMNRFGDTPLGMVESALEFVRIAEAHGYHDLILSMKASNPKVMIQAYRLLVERMDAVHRPYPLHLGVTEAGDGEDGRIKGAIGIGSLLLDGLGDTLRVSLTEDSVYEIPVARAIADKAMSLWVKPETGDWRPDSLAAAPISPPESGMHSPVSRYPVSADSIDPYHFTRRETSVLPLSGSCAVGPELPPRVVVRVPSVHQLGKTAGELAAASLHDTPVEGLLVPVPDAGILADLRRTLEAVALPAGFIILELAPSVTTSDLADLLSTSGRRLVLCRRFGPAASGELALWTRLVRSSRHFLAVDIAPRDLAALAGTLRELGDGQLLFTISDLRHPASEIAHALGAYRALTEQLRAAGSRAPIWIRNTAANAVHGEASFLGRLIEASFLTGGLLCDGVGDLVSVETEPDPIRATKLAYNLLQGAGARVSKTEFVACPSCGRTLFDLQTTTQRIRGKTGHLKGVKIAIMGCIVNGPGEMADADFGYVGGAPGKINLYAGRNCVQYNLPQAEADDRLIGLIKEHGRWLEPPAPAGSAPDRLQPAGPPGR